MIRAEVDYQINLVIDQTNAQTQKVELENKKIKAAIVEMEVAMKSLKGALVKVEENKQRKLIKKDKTISELTNIVMRQGVSINRTKKELEEAHRGRDKAQAEAKRLKAEVANT